MPKDEKFTKSESIKYIKAHGKSFVFIQSSLNRTNQCKVYIKYPSGIQGLIRNFKSLLPSLECFNKKESRKELDKFVI